jgi:hypothetical protein
VGITASITSSAWRRRILDLLPYWEIRVIEGSAMAYKDPIFYNLESNVGYGCPNKRTDVLLVQFFLREILNQADSLAARPPGKDLSVDGLFGSQTEAWIRAYQSFVKSKGKNIVVDGKVNAAPADYSARIRGNTAYTIAHLNATYRRRWRQDHDYLDKCARAPGELRAAVADPFGG